MDQNALRLACLGAVVTVAWAGPTAEAQTEGVEAADTVYLRTSKFHSLAMVRLVAKNTLTWIRISAVGAVPAGESYRPLVNESGYAFTTYAMLGVEPGGAHITLGTSQPNAILGRTFNEVFPGISEQAVIDAILNGGSTLDAFTAVIAGDDRFHLSPDEPATVIRFSTAEVAGEVQLSFSPIPEPATGAVLLGALGLGLLRRRAATPAA